VRYREWFVGQPHRFGELGIRTANVAAGLLGAVACIAIGAAVIYVAYELGHNAPRSDSIATTTNYRATVVLIVATVVVAPLVEETQFRGVLQASLAKVRSEQVRLIVVAVLFSASHFHFHSRPVALAQLFSLGYITALLRARTGGLTAPVIAHAGYNSVPWALKLIA
jgi:membrane protease YdiL (CAAX protease family)